MGEQTELCRRLHTGAFSPWPAQNFDRDFRHFSNHRRILATLVRQKSEGLKYLERAFEAAQGVYIEARSSANNRVCGKFALRRRANERPYVSMKSDR